MRLHKPLISDEDVGIDLEEDDENMCVHLVHMARPTPRRIKRFRREWHSLGRRAAIEGKSLWAVFPKSLTVMHKLVAMMPLELSHYHNLDGEEYVVYKYRRVRCPQS